MAIPIPLWPNGHSYLWLGGHSYSWLPQYYCIPYQQLHMHPAKTTAIESPREYLYLSTIEIPNSNAQWTPGRLWSDEVGCGRMRNKRG